ncbi:MAG TPA: thioredoxin domain-containing protein [Ignavibacteriaceae bacterium]
MNRLSKENSPYLLQHSNNPVDWFPWGEEAFENALRADKPVFLSIGYSTCHWCHVMEKESFEDEEIAALMNDAFISIKVDREERPDIDGIYMSVCQMLTGSGGWPLTIIMTPDKKPFFAGTYFPKESRFGRTGMKELIPQIKEIWLNKRTEVYRSASEIVKALNKGSSASVTEIDETIFTRAFSEFKSRYDMISGGFGTAPKFPSPHNLSFLLRYHSRFKDDESLQMVVKTLLEMRKGGIYDHIGYGFHRYSTDREWLVPHFEKMLYDQALLVIPYLELYQITGTEFYRKTVEEILEYVQRDLTSPEGGFYSAEDADSEGKEGKFYLWTMDEIISLLGDESGLISEVFNLKVEGNFTDPLNEEDNRENILHLKSTYEEIAGTKRVSESLIKDKIEKARKLLFEYREKRIHPYKDDKILTDWNALMISAFARASRVLGNQSYLESAVKAAEFILHKMRDNSGKLLHRYRNGKAGITASIDDYAFTISAFIDLYEAAFNPDWLRAAVELNNDTLKHFWDDIRGGFFFTPDYGEEMIVRQKEIYDGAIPSGNSAAVLNLMRLGRITGNGELERRAFSIVQAFSDQIKQMPSVFSQALIGLDFALSSSFEIVIVGNKNDRMTNEVISYINRKFLPNKIVLFKEPGDEELKLIAPFTELQNQIDNKTTVYICRNYVCERPVTDLNAVKEILG